MRILVTGCRYWHDYRKVQDVIGECLERARGKGEVLFVRHGDCPSGADKLAKCVVYAHQQAGQYNIIEEPYPADWDQYGKAAGPIRNQKMIDDGGIDEVHAFPLAGGKGTQDCMKRASDAGLEVINHGVPVGVPQTQETLDA